MNIEEWKRRLVVRLRDNPPDALLQAVAEMCLDYCERFDYAAYASAELVEAAVHYEGCPWLSPHSDECTCAHGPEQTEAETG